MKRKLKLYQKLLIAFCCIAAALTIILVTLYFTTQQTIQQFITLPVYQLPSEYVTTIDDSADYLGQPDMVKTRTGKFITIYPEGHGYGPLIMKTSTDGVNWETQTCPASWQNSQEVPTLYTLNRSDGVEVIILISGKPYWTAAGLAADGFQFSISTDDGITWTEFETVYSPMDCIVAMSSLTQLKENGEFVDKWLGTFHTHDFVNYKTILSFDENGQVQWSEPEPILSEYRSIEKRNRLCEIEIIRASDTLIMLTRNEARGGKTSMICFSHDEGQTWSQPQYLPNDLSGDRFQAAYDESTSQLLLSYRQIVPQKTNALSLTKFMTYGWVLWVGDIDDLLNYQEGQSTPGQCLIVLGADPSGDCGYSGIVFEDGKVSAVSYGYFDAGKTVVRAVNFNLDQLLASLI